MDDIASRSREATTDLVYDLHHIARSVLHQIKEEHHITGYDQEASTSHEPSIRPSVSSTPVRMQLIRDRGRGRVDRQGCGRDGDGGLGTPEPTFPTFIPLIFENFSYSLNLIFFMFSMFFQDKKKWREPKCSSCFSCYPCL